MDFKSLQCFIYTKNVRMQLSRFIFNLITQSNGNQQNTDEQAQRDLKCLIFPNKKKIWLNHLQVELLKNLKHTIFSYDRLA